MVCHAFHERICTLSEIASAGTEFATARHGLRLASGLELLHGPGDQSLLFVRDRGTYIRLSRGAAEVIRSLTATNQHTDIVAEMEQDWPASDRASTKEFIDQLIQSGALINAGEVTGKRHTDWIAWNPRDRLPLRFRLYRPDRIVMQCLATRFRASGQATRIAFLAVAAILISICLANIAFGSGVNWKRLPWGIVVAALVIHVLLHEWSHMLACSFCGVKIRESGIAILYWILPVFYIDRTDSYRLHQRWKLALIPSAGPLFDGCAAGIMAVAAWFASGDAYAVFKAISLLQAALFFINLNPLLPTDGFHALEALCGRANTRQRAFTFLLSQLGLRPLPSHLNGLSGSERRIYMTYGAVSAAYVGVLACMTVARSSHLVAVVLENFR